MSRFLVLDGVDGSGKSTQAKKLADALAEEARGAGRPEPLVLREPGTTRVGERIRELLLDRELEIGAPTEALLFTAARRQSLDTLVAPALEAGRDVICDRFHPSTYAYQAVGGGVPPGDVLALLRSWAGAPEPDLEVVLQLDPEEALRRRGAASDRIEDKGLEFQRAVAEGYRAYVEATPRAVAIDASGSPDDVAARVWDAVRAAESGRAVRHDG